MINVVYFRMKLSKTFLSLVALHQCNALSEVIVGKGGLEDLLSMEIGPYGAISAVVGGASYAYGKYKG